MMQTVLLFLLSWVATATIQPQNKSTNSGSTIIFPVSGNVYPQRYYYATINIGQPPKPYFVDVDTGSDLTWIQCDAPCVRCTPAPHSPYKPKRNLVMPHNDPICRAYHRGNIIYQANDDQCDYDISYFDHSLSLGVLVRDSVPLKLTNGTTVAPYLTFGCGYDQVQSSANAHYVDGVLGLGRGQATVSSQMHSMGLIRRNVVSHCFNGQGGGFLFFGDDLVPKSGIVWKALSGQSKHFDFGTADLQFAGQASSVKALQVVFDSGSTYTYFSSTKYKALVALIKKNIDGKQLKDTVEDETLSICWKDAKPFKSICDAVSYFKPLALRFTNVNNVQLPLPPESYLIVTKHGNVCLGILDGELEELGNTNVIGDISLQDKLVIYDNERRQIGWTSANCNRRAKS